MLNSYDNKVYPKKSRTAEQRRIDKLEAEIARLRKIIARLEKLHGRN